MALTMSRPIKQAPLTIGLRTIGKVFAIVAGSLACSGAARVEFEDNRLKVDGKPFFIYGCWETPNGDYAEFKRRHFNTAFMSSGAAPTEGPKAAAAGLMVMPYPYAPGWGEQMKADVRSVVDKDWVLAWNIGDDLASPEDLKAAIRVRDEIRAMDPQHRPIALDAGGQCEKFAGVSDMWCAYGYPLVKPAETMHVKEKATALTEYGEWLDAKRRQGRPDCFFWTWAQCHVQIWYNMEYLGGKEEGTAPENEVWRPSRFPDGDHLRLIAAHAISAGARGLMWFVLYYFQDDRLGRDRYARAATIGCELDIVGPLIAQGRRGERLKTSDPSVWATPIDFPGGRLICLIKTGNLYHYQPDTAEAKDVRVQTGMRGRIYQIGADFRELPQPRCSFELTSWLVVAQDKALVEQLRQKHRAVLPDMARFAVEELGARMAKVEPVLQELRVGDEEVGEARQRLHKAREKLRRDAWVEACRSAADGLRLLRVTQHRVWRDACANADLKMTDFYLLPKFAKEMKALKSQAWGPNQLRNGTFESDEGWSDAELGHDTEGQATLVTSVTRTGKRALRLMSDSPAIYQGEPQDWVTVNVVSEKIPAKPGELWEIAAWVRVPKRIAQTARGVTIALFAYNADGKRIAGYGAQGSEATQVEATGNWKRKRFVVSLRSPDAAAIAARLAFCGVGEAYLDDVTVRQLAIGL